MFHSTGIGLPTLIVLLLLQSVQCLRQGRSPVVRCLGLLSLMLTALLLTAVWMVSNDILVIAREVHVLLARGETGQQLLQMLVFGVPVIAGLAACVPIVAWKGLHMTPQPAAAGAGDGATQAGADGRTRRGVAQRIAAAVQRFGGAIEVEFSTGGAILLLALLSVGMIAVGFFGLLRIREITDSAPVSLRIFAFPLAAIWVVWSRACAGAFVGGLTFVCYTRARAWAFARRCLMAAIGLCVCTLAAIDPLHWLDVQPMLTFIAMSSGWLVFMEAATGGLTGNVRSLATRADTAAVADNAAVKATADGVGATWPTWLKLPDLSYTLAVKVAAGVSVLVLLAEFPNSRRTIVQPFRSSQPKSEAPGAAGQTGADIGQVFSERLINELGRIRQELQPDMTNLLNHGNNGVAVGGTAGASAADVLDGSQQIDLKFIKVPLRVFVAPIDAPIQWLFGIRTIEGSVQLEPGQIGDDIHGDIRKAADDEKRNKHGRTDLQKKSGAQCTGTLTDQDLLKDCCKTPTHVVVLASSSDGRVWNAERTECASGSILFRSRFDTVSGLAFNMLRDDPLISGNLTDSYDAFQRFEAGLSDWDKYKHTMPSSRQCQAAANAQSRVCARYAQWQTCQRNLDRWDACETGVWEEQTCNTAFDAWQKCAAGEPLLAAIDNFREATRIDPHFGLAYYRLGVALRAAAGQWAGTNAGTADGGDRDAAAEQDLHDARDAFTRSIELAWHVGAADVGLAMTMLESRSSADQTAAEGQCRRIAASDAPLRTRAAAAKLLCEHRVRQLKAEPIGAQRSTLDAVFYCKQAARLFADAGDAYTGQQSQAETALGLLLAGTAQSCTDGALVAAERYYDRALAHAGHPAHVEDAIQTARAGCNIPPLGPIAARDHP